MGSLLLVLAVLMPTLVYHGLAQLPADPQTEQIQHATNATVLVPDAKAPAGARVVSGVDLTISTYVSAAPGESADDSVVWRLATQVEGKGVGLVNARVETVSLDKHTALPTNCCADRLSTDEADPDGNQITHHGYITFPFNVQKHSYQLWDVQLNRARPAVFLGEEKRDGIDTYKFRATTPFKKIGTQELPGALFGLKDPGVVADSEYADTRTYWIEPATGSVVGLHEDLAQRFSYSGKKVTAISASLDSPSLSGDLLKQTQQGAVVLPWLRGRASWFLAIAGLILIGFWARSRFFPRPKRSTGSRAPTGAHSTTGSHSTVS